MHDRRPELEFTVSPNPASGSFSIRLPGPMNQDGLLTLYNALGSRVAAQTLPAGTTEREINIGELPAGVYTCRIAIGLELAGTKKIVVF
ncbi:MAG: T9SS type A sorting domain-containing protein [Saprospirales bacterium]|nr:T9SS type A sorting domain-containing protein [Saprospirales bacterium]